MKKVLIFFLLLISTASFAQKADSTEITAEKLADMIIQEARKYMGTRYSYGSSGGRGFDCSGLTSTVYSKFGYNLSRSSKGQAKDGRAVKGPISQLQKGDIVIFGSRRRSKTIGHVGIFIETNSTGTDFTFIHASTSNGVIISKMSEPYYDGRFLGARRIIPDFIPSDTTDQKYDFDIDNNVVRPDTLTLKESESRIVIFENGKWAYVANDGKLTEPSGKDKIVLDCANGNWHLAKTATKMIPTDLLQAEPKAKTEKAQLENKTETKPTDLSEDDSESVYHTIKSGDSLYSISKKYNVPINKICELNGMTTKTILQLGRKLKIK